MRRQEYLARVMAAMIILGTFAFTLWPRLFRDAQVVEIHARMAENGGWLPETIKAEVGKPLKLLLFSDDVVHSFAIGQSDFTPVDIYPGKVTEVTLHFDKPGKYTYYCTRWCGLNHWRMQGTIEVSGDGEMTGSVKQPLYLQLGIDIDAQHNAQAIPEISPSAERGADLAGSLPITTGNMYFNKTYYLERSPEQVFLDLRSSLSADEITDSQVWDLVAYIWQVNSTPQSLEQASKLFSENCAACHGENGRGDGVYSDDLSKLSDDAHARSSGSSIAAGHSYQKPVDFSDPVTILGASPALLQGKIIRGGMGTGMPYWGPILTEDQTWQLVSLLYTFYFMEVGKE